MIYLQLKLSKKDQIAILSELDFPDLSTGVKKLWLNMAKWLASWLKIINDKLG
jgi:hypothetical protein